jgi:hypothetical protein
VLISFDNLETLNFSFLTRLVTFRGELLHEVNGYAQLLKEIEILSSKNSLVVSQFIIQHHLKYESLIKAVLLKQI